MRWTAAWLAAACVLSACSSVPPLPPPPRAPPPVSWPPPMPNASTPLETPDAPFRDHVPEPGPPVTFHAPKIEAFNLKNGVRVLLVERHDLPLVSLRVVSRTGAGELGLRPGEAAFLGAMVEQGTESRTSLQISDALLAMGASHATWVDWDSGQITIEALATKLDGAIDLLADLALHASFPKGEVDRLKARWAAALRAERTNALSEASNATAAALYGRAHPYGHSLYGKADDVEKATHEELADAWARELDRSRCAIVVAGDVTRDAIAPKLERAFADWKARAPIKRAMPAPKPLDARLVVVDRPGASQSQVTVAEVGIASGAPDRDAVGVMNAILGGMFSSHINLNLRESHAYTYDARSRFATRHAAGPFTVMSAVAADETAPAVKEILAEVEKMRNDDVSNEELADAKEFLALGLPARFETLTDVTGALADLAVYDLPLEEYAAKQARITAVTAADVRRAAQAHLHTAKLKVIVVGDAHVLGPSLETLGLGTARALDAYGDPAQ